MPKYQLSCEAQPQYLPRQSAPDEGVYVFSYTITITNTGDIAAQVIARHWLISDANGVIEEVKGLGVVGHQPLLAPGESFRYTSGSRLHTASGTMRGSYFCVAEDGERFEAKIPVFVLDASGGPEAGAHSHRVLH